MTTSRTIAIGLAAFLQGGYMIFDGIHQLVTGTYFGNRVGPWARIPEMFGISPQSLAPAFVLLGALWIAALLSLLFKFRASTWLLVLAAMLSLFYLPVGTILSLVVLLLLLVERHRIRPI